MTDVLLFGGTTEGRQLAHCLKEQGIPTLVCVATEYGESLLQEGGSLRVHPGRLDENAMLALMHREQPKLVLDATHPYAAAVSQTVAAACAAAQVPYHRVLRRSAMEDGCMLLRDMEEMIDFLSATEGVVFSSLGSKAAKELCRVRDYQSRLWLRILPTVSSISDCLDAGFPAAHLICMQGPFSRELNAAMFRATGAKILITKESGATGGFPEKVAAARDCGMTVAVLARPQDFPGLTCEAWLQRIKEGNL